jgi:hypothetical protein
MRLWDLDFAGRRDESVKSDDWLWDVDLQRQQGPGLDGTK